MSSNFFFNHDRILRRDATDFVAGVITSIVSDSTTIEEIAQKLKDASKALRYSLSLAADNSTVYWGEEYMGKVEPTPLPIDVWYREASPQEQAAFVKGLHYCHGLVCSLDESGENETISKAATLIFERVEAAVAGIRRL